MTAVLSNMLWLPKSELTDAQQAKLKQTYTLTGKPQLDGTETILRAYSDMPDWLGIPRQSYGAYPGFRDQTIAPKVEWPKLTFPNKGDWRGNQEETVDKLTQYFQSGKYGARLEAPCGSGKSWLALAVAARLNVPAIILVHKQDLAIGWHTEAQKFFPGVILGHVQGDQWNYIAGHATTCLVQTLWKRRGQYPKGFLNQFGMVIVDEGHRFSSQTFEYVFKIFPARYRLAVSATWRRRDELDAWDYHVGPKVATCKVDTMTGRYVQVNLDFWIAGTHPKMPMATIITKIGQDIAYNEWLSKELVKAVHNDRKVVLLSDRIDQLRLLQVLTYRELARCGIRKTASLYIGEKTTEEKEVAKKADIILGTYQALSEGTNIPALDTLIFGTPRSDVEQCVGRIQRVVRDKKSLLIVDPVLYKYGFLGRMAIKRVGWMEKLGFRRAQACRAKL